MAELTFPASEVEHLLTHTRAATRRRPTYEQMHDPALRKDGRTPSEEEWPAQEDVDVTRVPAGLWLVGDHGVYLMSNAELAADETRARLVYAREANPETLPFDAWWEAKRATFGRDDGSEFLDATLVRTWLDGARDGTLRVRFAGDTMEFL